MRVSSWADFQGYLISKSPDGQSYGFAEFDVDVQYVEPAPDLASRPMHIVLVKNRIIGVSHSIEQSTDEALAELTLSTMYITRNGGVLFDSSGGFPG
jgi:hypothetical protein